jgi:Holliday junction resolvase RusA-like endonuclease
MKALTLVVPGKPTPKQSMRFTKGGIRFQPKKVLDAQSSIAEHALFRMHQEGWTPIQGLVCITRCLFVFPPPSTMRVAERKWLAEDPRRLISKGSRPDFDNCLKMLLDGLSNIMFTDDARAAVLSGFFGTFWGADARTEIALHELEPGTRWSPTPATLIGKGPYEIH